MSNNISWLTTVVPASDIGFKGHLKAATKDEIETAIGILQNQRRIVSGVPIGNKTKIAALERELRKRERSKGNDERRQD